MGCWKRNRFHRYLAGDKSIRALVPSLWRFIQSIPLLSSSRIINLNNFALIWIMFRSIEGRWQRFCCDGDVTPHPFALLHDSHFKVYHFGYFEKRTLLKLTPATFRAIICMNHNVFTVRLGSLLMPVQNPLLLVWESAWFSQTLIKNSETKRLLNKLKAVFRFIWLFNPAIQSNWFSVLLKECRFHHRILKILIESSARFFHISFYSNFETRTLFEIL